MGQSAGSRGRARGLWADRSEDPLQSCAGRAAGRRSYRRYVHLSTGNYNAVTAHLYTDIGMFTASEEVADDVTHLFNYLTGYSAKSATTSGCWWRR